VSTSLSFSFSVVVNDLYRFSPSSNSWTAISVASPPSARWGMGFAATPDGMLYVFGGNGNGRKELVWCTVSFCLT
jgi:N-acetylneuraminic acid mutarotase